MGNDYWDLKFKNKKYIWGTEESESARIVLKDISRNCTEPSNSLTILDVGCGYGRDLHYFAFNGFHVYGIDSSQEAINLGLERWPDLKLQVGDILNDLNIISQQVDFVFCNFFVHLFLKKERQKIISKVYQGLKENGIAYFIVSSDEDDDFIRGELIGDNLVKNARGVVKFYYNQELVYQEFHIFQNISITKMTEKHNHDYEHEHTNYIIKCEK